MSRHGAYYRKYSTQKETVEQWSKGLTKLYGKPFQIKENIRETVFYWSKLF